MSGFDTANADEGFFGAGVEHEGMCEEYVPGTVKSNFLCNIGYSDPASVRPHALRLDFPRFAAYSESSRGFESCEPYATTAEARSAGCSAGASAISATPMTTKRATPTSSLRGIMLSNAWKDIIAAWAKLDQAVKAMRLRCDNGSREATSKKIPSVV